MNKRWNIIMLTVFLTASLCGCSAAGGKSSAPDSQISVEQSADNDSSDSDFYSDRLPVPDTVDPQTARQSRKDILLQGGWQFLDGKAFGKELSGVDQGKINGASIWFRSDDTCTITLDGTRYDAGYEIGEELGVTIRFVDTPEAVSALAHYLDGNAMSFYFAQDAEYGTLLTLDHFSDGTKEKSVRFYMTMI